MRAGERNAPVVMGVARVAVPVMRMNESTLAHSLPSRRALSDHDDEGVIYGSWLERVGGDGVGGGNGGVYVRAFVQDQPARTITDEVNQGRRIR